MKMKVFTSALASALVMLMFLFTSCSGSVNAEKVQELAKQETLTSSDYDFLIDQVQIVCDKITDMSKPEAEAFIHSDEGATYFSVLMECEKMLKKAHRNDALSEEQNNRMNEFAKTLNEKL